MFANCKPLYGYHQDTDGNTRNVVVVLHNYTNCLVSVYNNYVANKSSGEATVCLPKDTCVAHCVNDGTINTGSVYSRAVGGEFPPPPPPPLKL